MAAWVFSSGLHSVTGLVQTGLGMRKNWNDDQRRWAELRCLYYQGAGVWNVQSPDNQYSCHSYTRMTNEHSKHLWERVVENIRQKIKKTPRQNTPGSSHISIIKKRRECGAHANLPGFEWPCKSKMWEEATKLPLSILVFLSSIAMTWENVHTAKTSSLTRQQWNVFSPSEEAGGSNQHSPPPMEGYSDNFRLNQTQRAW